MQERARHLQNLAKGRGGSVGSSASGRAIIYSSASDFLGNPNVLRGAAVQQMPKSPGLIEITGPIRRGKCRRGTTVRSAFPANRDPRFPQPPIYLCDKILFWSGGWIDFTLYLPGAGTMAIRVRDSRAHRYWSLFESRGMFFIENEYG